MKNIKISKRTKKDFAWTQWTVASMRKAAKSAIEEYQSNISDLLQEDNISFNHIVPQVELWQAELREVTGPIENVWFTHPQKKMREAAQQESENISKVLIDLHADTKLLNIFDMALKTVKRKDLGTDEQRLYDDYLLGLKHGGFYLDKKDQTKLKALRKKNMKLANDFEATINNWDEGIYMSEVQAEAFPKTYLDQLVFNKKKKKYRVTLDYPQLIPFMRICPDENLRKEMAELLGKKGGKKNLQRLKDIVKTKTEISNILGYETFADMNLVNKMAKNTETVTRFIDKNIEKYFEKAKSELDVLRYAKERTGSKNKLAGHDVSYFIDRVQEELFQLDSELLKQYFPLNHVVDIMFDHFGKFFGLEYKEMKIKHVHDDVRTFEVTDKKTKEQVGCFSIDMHPREGKFSHACMQDTVWSYEKKGKMMTPVANLIMNVANPTKETPSLLDMREVETLFHEFGHIMHGVLGKAQFGSQAGTSVARDFVEVPSQMFEEWIYEDKILKKLGKHYKTGKSLPKEMFSSIKSSRVFMENYTMLRAFVFSKIDMDIYTNPKKVEKMDKVFADCTKKYLLPVAQGSLQPASFAHIADGYAAGYYGYMWSLELAKKIFKHIKKEGSSSVRVGKKLRKELLERGDTEDPNVLMKNFLKK